MPCTTREWVRTCQPSLVSVTGLEECQIKLMGLTSTYLHVGEMTTSTLIKSNTWDTSAHPRIIRDNCFKYVMWMVTIQCSFFTWFGAEIGPHYLCQKVFLFPQLLTKNSQLENLEKLCFKKSVETWNSRIFLLSKDKEQGHTMLMYLINYSFVFELLFICFNFSQFPEFTS